MFNKCVLLREKSTINKNKCRIENGVINCVAVFFCLVIRFYAYWFITQYLRGESVWRGQVVQYGRHRKRRNYARISEVLELPNLIEIQTKSYDWFLKKVY